MFRFSVHNLGILNFPFTLKITTQRLFHPSGSKMVLLPLHFNAQR